MKKVLVCLLMLLRPGAGYAAEELQTIVVKPGDTLWSISNTYLKDPKKWNVILKYNRLPSSDPSIALPGMPLRVPTTLLKEEYRAAKLVYSLNEVLFRRTGVTDWQGVNIRARSSTFFRTPSRSCALPAKRTSTWSSSPASSAASGPA
jgi:hypothetical protein